MKQTEPFACWISDLQAVFYISGADPGNRPYLFYIVPFTKGRSSEFTARTGRKEEKMLKKKEKDLCVQGMMETREDCPPIIREIAHGAAGFFEYATEFGAFENDEDDQAADLLLMLYRGGNYTEAVRLLRFVFSSIHCEAACALLSLIHDDNGEKREEFFVREFMFCSTRCRFREMFESEAGTEKAAAGEEQQDNGKC